MLHGDGEPLLITYEDDESRFCYTVMKQDIATCPGFVGELESNTYYDFETPYGYGGPLSDVPIPRDSQERFIHELLVYCINQKIVSQFIRFNPVLGNHDVLAHVIQSRYLRDTIFMDTSSRDLIMSNMDGKNRNMIRKAIKNGITIERRQIEHYHEFVSMYAETMQKNQADEYYLFSENYFASLMAMHDHACIFYAMMNSKPIAGAIMLYNDMYMHYHLAGTHGEYRQYGPSNLLLYEAGCWASEHGIKKFHLGGGMSPDDSLFLFKKKFNRNGHLPFVVGRTIFDPDTYDMLRLRRKEIDPTFDEENTFMIQYRR
jgi:hypothetical protein